MFSCFAFLDQKLDSLWRFACVCGEHNYFVPMVFGKIFSRILYQGSVYMIVIVSLQLFGLHYCSHVLKRELGRTQRLTAEVNKQMQY